MPAIFTAVNKRSYSSASQISDYIRMTEKDIIETIVMVVYTHIVLHGPCMGLIKLRTEGIIIKNIWETD